MRTPHRVVKAFLAAALVATGLALPGSTVGTHTGSALLPDLVMLQPEDFRLERKPGGVRWLRFSTIIANVGDGPFDVYGYEPTGATITRSSHLQVRQRVVESVDSAGNRTWIEHEAIGDDGKPSRMFYSGDGHDHWHVFGLQEWRLAYEATPSGTLETGAKTGFCFWDNVDLGWGMPKEYDGSWACHVASNGKRVPMGQSVGWGDEYPSTIAGQYIDITQYPFGNYCLTLAADPRGEFFEETTANNTVRTLISIQTSGVTVLAQDCGEPDTTAPNAPMGLTATAGDQTVVLDWDDNPETDSAEYNVYRNGAFLTSVSSSALIDGSLENGTQYCYEVTAVDPSDNESPRAGPVCATPAATEGGDPTVVHVADLEGQASVKGQSGRWEALVTITVMDGTGALVDGATVTATWTGAASGTVTATTSGGTVTISTGNLSTGSEATLTVDGISATGLTYDETLNDDADNDTNGTTITVTKT